MEEWQRKHVTQKLPELIHLTNFNIPIKARLIAENILAQAEVNNLSAIETQCGTSDISYHYYQLLMGRTNSYKVLTKALMENHQSGAARLLIDGVPTHVSDKPLTYLDVPIKLERFQDMEIEVNGKKLLLHEFFLDVNYEELEQLFLNAVSELNVYDTFVTKQRTFLLANNTVPPKPTYYVPRFLSNRIKIDEYIFKVDCLDVFVFKKTIARYKLSQIAKPHFTDTSTSQLNKITSRFIYLDGDEDWSVLKKLAKVPIHLINYDSNGNHFLLEDSSAPSDFLRKLGSREQRVYMSEEEFVEQQLSENCASSSVCICDTPGMGKTFLLANIARFMADKCVRRIFVFIQLSSFAQHFVPVSSNTTLGRELLLMNVLSYICPSQQKPKLLLELVKAKLIRLDIFFDGFDEITTDKVNLTKQVFRCFATIFPNVRIYITSRPHMRQELENGLGVVAYDILPFNNQNQIDFLVQFWKNKKPVLDHLTLKTFAAKCLNFVNESLTKSEKEIAGLPLLCHLIAEVYSDKVATHLVKTKFRDFPLKIAQMYEKFIEKKIKLVAKDREEFDHIKMFHVWHALKLLFPTNKFHEQKQFEIFEGLLLTYSKMLRIGILQKHSNGALEFIHRTFGEYLVAEYFLTKLTEMQKTEEIKGDSISILKLLLNCRKNEVQYRIFHTYMFNRPVIVSFFNYAIEIFEKLKIQAAVFVSSISNEDFIDILCAFCEHNLFNIFCLLTQSLTNEINSRILECFTNAKNYELIDGCIRESTSQMFQKCIQLLTQYFKFDLEQVNTSNNSNKYTLFQTAVRWANYEAVEYFAERISLKNQSLFEHCVDFSDEKDDIEKKTLIHETPHILCTSFIDVRLFKTLVQFEANLTGANIIRKNCAMHAAWHMSSTNYHELVKFILADCKAECLFVENEKWKNPQPQIIETATLLPETLELFLNLSGNDINMKDENGENLLFSAARGNKMDNFQQLLDRGLDYNARGEENRSLLHAAAQHGHVLMVRYLLSLKLDPNSLDQNELTPLHYAALHNILSLVEVLVENGANVRAKTKIGQTALHFSAKTNYTNKEIIKYLFGIGISLNDCDVNGNTPLHLCMTKEAKDALIEMGADIHAKNEQGQTPAQMNPDLWK